MKTRTVSRLLVAGAVALALAGCGKSSPPPPQQTQAAPSELVGDGGVPLEQAVAVDRDSKQPRINLDQVKEALAQIQEKDPDDWLKVFEQKVNEIHTAYEPNSKEVISITAKPDDQKRLHIMGFISAAGNGTDFDDRSDTKVFDFVQTNTLADESGQIQYTMTGYTYGNDPIIIQDSYYNPGMSYWMYNSIVRSLLWHSYFTSPYRYHYMMGYRHSYMGSPGFNAYRSRGMAYSGRTWGGTRMTVAPVSPAARSFATRPMPGMGAAPLGAGRSNIAPPRVFNGAPQVRMPTTRMPTMRAPARSFGGRRGR